MKKARLKKRRAFAGPSKVVCVGQSALTRLKALLYFIDYVDTALTAHDTAIAVAIFQRFE
jgi:hypothetical protein